MRLPAHSATREKRPPCPRGSDEQEIMGGEGYTSAIASIPRRSDLPSRMRRSEPHWHLDDEDHLGKERQVRHGPVLPGWAVLTQDRLRLDESRHEPNPRRGESSALVRRAVAV